MATEEGNDGGGVDRISSLPDDLLHAILIRLRDPAARTSVLSRRWRRVWAHLPELSFRCRSGAPDCWLAPELVGAALAAYAGTAIRLLEISPLRWLPSVGGDCPLMQFASLRVAGELRLSLRKAWGHHVVLPPCKRVTAITLSAKRLTMLFAPPHPALGTFAALASLRIIGARVDGRELGDVLDSRCPRLKELFLKRVLVRCRDLPRVISIRSDSLERLEMDMDFKSFDASLQVIAPKLKVFSSPRIFSYADIVAPKLTEVCWHGPYDPDRHHLREAGRHLQRLEIASRNWNSQQAAMLMLRFNAVHELQLTVQLRKVR